MSVGDIIRKIQGESLLSGEPLRMQELLPTAEEAGASAAAGDLFSLEHPVADLDGVVKKRTAGQAEVPIRTGILRNG